MVAYATMRPKNMPAHARQATMKTTVRTTLTNV